MAQPEVHCTPLFCKTILQGGSPKLKLRFRVKYEKYELTELGLGHNSGKEDRQIGHPDKSFLMLLYFTRHIACSLKSSCDPSVCQDRGSTACGDGTAFANSKLNHSTATYIVGPTVQYSAGQLEDKSSFSVNRPIEALRCGTFKPRSSSQLTNSTSANYLK